MNPVVVVSPRGEERLRSGHPWIYRADVADVRAEAGDIVQVRSARGRTLGSALFSDRSQITLRMLSHGDQAADEALVRRRIETAIAFRESLALDATAYRIVHGEADLLPSLIVDRYGDYLVVQALSQGMDRLMPAVVVALTDVLHPRGILARNDPRARVLEGLEQRVDVLAGSIPETLTVTEIGIEYGVDLRRGQKTGLFLDQRENRAAAAAYAQAGYKEINLRALKLLNPGGTLVTCSCSYHVNEAAFAEIVYDAAVDAQVHMTVVEKRMQGRDHPVLLGVPETYYLKCFILRKLG